MSSLAEKIEEMKQICQIKDDEDEQTEVYDSNVLDTHDQARQGNQENQTDLQEPTESLAPAQKKSRQYEAINIVEQPKTLVGGQLKYYQMDSLAWLMNIHRLSMIYHSHFLRLGVKNPQNYQINAILADQMGLGKTIQTIALFCQVFESYGIRGRHLIVVPKSTLPQWEQEIAKWAPMFRVLVVIGEKEERARNFQSMAHNRADVVLTTYDVIRIEQQHFAKHEYSYMVFDEGHKLKDSESMISQAIKSFKADHKLLLTGTPIQNDLKELWSLLNVLMPYIFSSPEEFMQLVNAGRARGRGESRSAEPGDGDAGEPEPSATTSTVREGAGRELTTPGPGSVGSAGSASSGAQTQIQRILRYFILRREKREVETLPPKTEYLLKCPMTTLQKQLYKGVLQRDLDSISQALRSRSAELGKTSLLNILMQLRKVADHPYLLKGVEPEPHRDGDHLINSAGKMVVLHALLTKIIARGEKVLIFCQMTAMLNLVTDYLHYKGVKYVRIDGSTELETRSASMQHFMREDSQYNVFVLSTRAGCLGLNLTAANHVIIYQQDYNPQVDAQAVARSYRILQKKPVYVYRLLAENSVDEKIYERACVKMELDQLIIQSGNFSGKQSAVDRDVVRNSNKNGLLDLISFKTTELFHNTENSGQKAGSGAEVQLPDYNLGPEVEFPEEKVDQLLNEAAEFQRQYYEKAEQEKQKAANVLAKLQEDGKLDGFDTRELYQFEGESYGKEQLKKLAYELQQQKQQRVQQRFHMQVTEEERDKRWYPTVQRFKKSSLYRPDFYLLPRDFYRLQERVLKEISERVEPIFAKDAKITYEEFLAKMKKEDPETYNQAYIDQNLPGLNSEQAAAFMKYVQQGCPYLAGKDLTKKEFNQILNSLADYDPAQYPEQLGVKKLKMTDLAEQKAVESPVLGETLFPYQLMSEKLDGCAPAKSLDLSGRENLDVAYLCFARSAKSAIGEEEFHTYAQQLLTRLDELDEGARIRQRLAKAQQRRQAFMRKCYWLRATVERYQAPLLEMAVPAVQQARRTYSTLQDRFLIYLADGFGYGRWAEVLTFIRVCPAFAGDWWFRSRDEDEIAARVDALIAGIQAMHERQ